MYSPMYLLFVATEMIIYVLKSRAPKSLWYKPSCLLGSDVAKPWLPCVAGDFFSAINHIRHHESTSPTVRRAR